MAFLNPSYLWALFGLAVPIIIHLWSRKEGRIIKVGSIQFLKKSDPRQASSINLNELWLLLLRMLAISILVFILAGPVLKQDGSRSALTYVIEPSLFKQEQINRIIDSIGSGDEVRLLETNFPAYVPGEAITSEEIPDYWRLAQKMQELNTDSIVVFTAGYVQGLKGRRPQAAGHINWIQIIPDEIFDAPIAAIQKAEEVEIISVSADHSLIAVEKEMIPRNSEKIRTTINNDSIIIDQRNKKYFPIRIQDTINVGLFNDDSLEEQMRYIRSSLNAISTFLDIPIKTTSLSLDETNAGEKDLLVWLSNSPIRFSDIPLLKWQPDSLANSLIEPGKGSNVFYLTKKLDSENIVDENFPEQLLKVLNINKELEQEIVKYDRRVMPLGEIIPQTGSIGSGKAISNFQDITKYLWWILGLILIVERGLSDYRKQ